MADKKVSIIYTIKDKASKGIKALTEKITGLINPINLVKKGLVGLGVASAGLATIALRTAGKFEQWSVAFETLTGSAEKAKILLEEINDFAKKTPFQVTGLVESSKQLLAFGIEAENVIGTMENLGNIAAGIGTDKLETLVRAFGKIRTKGKATMEELNMLLEAGVPILDQLSTNLEVTKEQLFGLITQGQVSFEDVQKALTDLSTGTGQFANLMENQSKTFFGIISNIRDNLTQVALLIGNELLPKFKGLAESLKDFTDPQRFKEFVINVKIQMLELETIIKKTMTTIERAIARPFEFETYKVIFTNLITNINKIIEKNNPVAVLGRFFNKTFDLGLSVAQKLSDKRKELNQELLEEEKTLSDQLLEIEKNRQLQIDEFNKEIAELKKEREEEARAEELEKNAEHNQNLINQKQELNDKIMALDLLAQNAKDRQIELNKKKEQERAKALDKVFTDIKDSEIKNAEDAKKAVGNAIKQFLIKEIDMFTQAAIANALANVPFPANLAAAAVVAALGAAAKTAVNGINFEDGGIVGGGSLQGDKVKANVNSGEMILNREQQTALFGLINNAGALSATNNSETNTGSNVIILTDDGTELAKGIFNKQEELFNTGELTR